MEQRQRRRWKLTSGHSILHTVHQLPRLLQIFIVVKPVLPPGDLGRITVRARAPRTIHAQFPLQRL